MAAEKKRAEKTSFIIGRIGPEGLPITDRTEMIGRRYAATSFSHDEDSAKQESESLRGGEAEVFGEDGPLWGSGGIEMELPLHGLVDILQPLLRDKNPVSTAIPDKTLVASGTDLSDIVADDYFTNATTAADRNPDPNRPGQFRVKYTGGTLTGHTMLVRGVRRVGLASDDTLPLKEEIDLGADVLTAKYFHRINKVEIKDSNGDPVAVDDLDGEVEITSEPGGFETVIKMSGEEVLMMMEAEVGGDPRRITKAQFVSGQLNISNNVRLAIEMLSSRVDQRSTIEGGDDEKFVATAVEHSSEFPFVTEKFFPDWGGYLEIDGEAFVFNSATVDVNRNEDFSEGKRATRFRPELESGGRRQVTTQIQGSYVSGTAEEDVFIRWDQKFRNNEAVDAKIANYHWPSNGRQHSMEWIMPYCEVTAPIRVEATSPGTIPITIPLKAVPETAGASEMEVRIVSDDQWV